MIRLARFVMWEQPQFHAADDQLQKLNFRIADYTDKWFCLTMAGS